MNFPLSREDLQRLPSQREEKELNEYICKVVKQISETVVQFAYQGKTKYTHANWLYKNLKAENFEEIGNRVKENFTDCVITTEGSEEGRHFSITIDWS